MALGILHLQGQLLSDFWLTDSPPHAATALRALENPGSASALITPVGRLPEHGRWSWSRVDPHVAAFETAARLRFADRQLQGAVARKEAAPGRGPFARSAGTRSRACSQPRAGRSRLSSTSSARCRPGARRGGGAAERHHELIADLAAERALLRKAQVVGSDGVRAQIRHGCWATNRRCSLLRWRFGSEMASTLLSMPGWGSCGTVLAGSAALELVSWFACSGLKSASGPHCN